MPDVRIGSMVLSKRKDGYRRSLSARMEAATQRFSLWTLRVGIVVCRYALRIDPSILTLRDDAVYLIDKSVNHIISFVASQAGPRCVDAARGRGRRETSDMDRIPFAGGRPSSRPYTRRPSSPCNRPAISGPPADCQYHVRWLGARIGPAVAPFGSRMILRMAVWRLRKSLNHGHDDKCQRESEPTRGRSQMPRSNPARRITLHCGSGLAVGTVNAWKTVVDHVQRRRSP